MSIIAEMPRHLADLIAAGEVVERPGSVVKELVENSIDAGATQVTVEISGGGRSLIRVSDNGSGILRDDVETAFLRHATSKLRDERGLEAISTLGFRGEALAAISSVARIELLTKARDEDEGTRYLAEGGSRISLAPAGLPDGTTILVRDLFFNTPARLKFMKSDRAEGANVTVAVVRLALSHPEVSLRYIRDGSEELHTPGDGRLESAIYCTLGRDVARTLLPASNESDGARVSGFVSTPAGARGNRASQFFFINGRFIKSQALQGALEQAYRNSLFTGRFPACVLNIELSPGKVDVNVHPAKLEVRFSDDRAVAGAVYWAAMNALEKENAPVEMNLPKELFRGGGADARQGAADGRQDRADGRGDGFYRTVSADDFRKTYNGGAPGTLQLRDSGGAAVRSPTVSARVYPAARVSSTDRRAVTERREDDPPVRDVPDAPGLMAPGPGFRYIGEAMDTYLIVERGDSLCLIDKHAAHERILFDALKSKKRQIHGQLLLTPVVCAVGDSAAGTLLENRELLLEYGFEIDDFGGGTVALRQVPEDMDPDDPEALLEELAEKLASGGRRNLDSMRDDILHTVACRAAIKAGRRSEPAAVQGLIARVMSGEVRYCPHGRPVLIEISKSQLDKSFRRA